MNNAMRIMTGEETQRIDLAAYKSRIEEYIRNREKDLPGNVLPRADLPEFSWDREGNLDIKFNIRNYYAEDFKDLIYLFGGFYGQGYEVYPQLRQIYDNHIILRYESKNQIELRISDFMADTAGLGIGLSISKFAYPKDLDFFYQLWNNIVLIEEEKIDPETELKELGVELIKDFTPWDALGGYDDLKEKIRETVLLPFQHKEVYQQIVEKTRQHPKDITPRAILLYGPSGTGKTTMGKIIAGETKLPFVYVPIESIFTMWYGQSPRRLSRIFRTVQSYENCVLFIDEIDALATRRNSEMHEESRRVLSVLLTRLDGMKTKAGVITIGATNRIDDLDFALRRRFDEEIYFGLPNLQDRKSIFGLYAKHLSDSELNGLARKTKGFSGSDIETLAKSVERTWGKKIIEENATGKPEISLYVDAITRKKNQKNQK